MTDPGEFLTHMSDRAPQSQNTQSMEIALGAIAAWGTDSTKSNPSRGTCQKFMCHRFISWAQEVRNKLKGPNSLQGYSKQNYTVRENTPHKEWVHKGVHILDPVEKNRHIEVELRHGIISGDCFISFLITLFINKSGPVVDIAFRSSYDRATDVYPGVDYQTKGQNHVARPSNLRVLL